MVDVFISYARSESEPAQRVKRLLEDMGLTVFLDVEGLDGGDVFPDVFDNAIKTAGVVLSLWSPHSLSRPWVKKECYIGQMRGVLVPVAISPLNVQRDIPALFMDMQFLDLVNFDGDAKDPRWRKVVGSLARTLKRPDLVQRRGEDSGDSELHKLRRELAELRKSPVTKAATILKAAPKIVAGLPKLWLAGGAAAVLAAIVAAVVLMQPPPARSLEADLKSIDVKAPGFIPQEAWLMLTNHHSIAEIAKAAETNTLAAAFLGRAYADGNNTGINDTQAQLLVQRSCSAGEIFGCNTLGRIRQFNRDYDGAREQFQKACDGGFMGGCTNLGLLYETGQIGKPDPDKAITLYTKACGAGEVFACGAMGFLLDKNPAYPRDPDRAATLYKQACDGRVWRNCIWLGDLYMTGAGVQRNDDTAHGYFLRACLMQDYLGCARLGELAADGRGGKLDHAEARLYFTYACNNHEIEACNDLGLLYRNGHGVPQNDETARTIFESACKSDFAIQTACGNLGDMYRRGAGGAKDIKKAVELFRRACNDFPVFDAPSCGDLGFLLMRGIEGAPKDIDAAVEPLQKACDGGGIAPACTDLAAIYSGGLGIKQDVQLSLTYLNKGCQLHDKLACESIDKLKGGQTKMGAPPVTASPT